MRDSAVCNATDHLFLPVLEVHDALLRCVRCDVFAYQETVKELAKTRAYAVEDSPPVPVGEPSRPGRISRWLRPWRFLPGLRNESKLR